MRADGALGKDRTFPCDILFIIQFLQRQQQRVSRIFGKGKAVAIAADMAVLFHKAVVELVQLVLQFVQTVIVAALCLLCDQYPHSTADPDHGAGAFFCCLIKCRWDVLSCRVEKQLAIPDKVTVFCDLLLCVLRIPRCVPLEHIRISMFRQRVRDGNMMDSIRKLLFQVCTRKRRAGGIIAISGAFHLHFTQNHFRMGDEITVHRKPVCDFAKMYPLRLGFRRRFPLLQEQDIRRDLCTCIGLERIIGQADRAEQVCFLRKQTAYMLVLLIQCAFGRDKGNDAVRLYFIQCFHKEIVVDQQIILVVPLVMQFIVPKWDVADSEVKGVVRKGGILKS